ncbi:MAG: hypothetical protein ABSA33_00805 [Candidatus Micrarchaeaceae archaeon]
MEKLRRSEARGNAKKVDERAQDKTDKIINGLSEGSQVLGTFLQYIKSEQIRSKVMELDSLCRSGFSDQIRQGNSEALGSIKEVAGTFGAFRQNDFHNRMFDEMHKAKLEMRIFSKKETEAKEVKELIKDIERYLKKASHSASRSKIQRARYFAGQATFANSIDEEYQGIVERLGEISIKDFKSEVVRLAEKRAEITVYEKAFDTVEHSKKGTFAAKEFLDSLDQNNIGDYGMSTRSTTQHANAQQNQGQNGAANVQQQHAQSNTQNAANANGANGQQQFRQAIEGTVSNSWVKKVNDYYGDFSKWANLDERQQTEFEGLIKEVNETRSMAASMELWKRINVMWVQNADVVPADRKAELADWTMDSKSEKDMVNVSRELLALYVNHYLPVITMHATGSADVANLIKENHDYMRQPDLTSRPEGGEKTYQELIEENERKLKDLIVPRRLPFSKPKGEFATLKNARVMGAPPSNLTARNFYDQYLKMNEMLDGNISRKPSERDYSGNDIMWDYMRATAEAVYKMRLMPEEGRRGEMAPPSFGSPTKEQEMMPPPPLEPLAAQIRKMPTPYTSHATQANREGLRRRAQAALEEEERKKRRMPTPYTSKASQDAREKLRRRKALDTESNSATEEQPSDA